MNSETHPNVALVAKAYQALNRTDLDSFISAFAEDAVLYGGDGQIEGNEAILSVPATSSSYQRTVSKSLFMTS
jgi:hypothetical protein